MGKVRAWIGPILLVIIMVTALGFVRAKAENPIPDPNDPKDVKIVDALVLQRNLKWASDFINERRALGEITDEKGRALLATYASDLIEHIQMDRMEPQEAWRYAEVFRTAQDWENAKEALLVAVEHAKQHSRSDRFTVDTLRLAEAEAHLGNSQGAIELVRSTFSTPPEGKAPILLATYLEVVPPLRDKKVDLELAKLVEDAIYQHAATRVDVQKESGRAFLSARGYHMTRAWRLVQELYRKAGRDDLALKVPQKSKDLSETLRREYPVRQL